MEVGRGFQCRATLGSGRVRRSPTFRLARVFESSPPPSFSLSLRHAGPPPRLLPVGVRAGCGAPAPPAAADPADAVIRSGVPWYDTDGNRMFAGGANMYVEDGVYYLIGEGKKVLSGVSMRNGARSIRSGVRNESGAKAGRCAGRVQHALNAATPLRQQRVPLPHSTQRRLQQLCCAPPPSKQQRAASCRPHPTPAPARAGHLRVLQSLQHHGPSGLEVRRLRAQQQVRATRRCPLTLPPALSIGRCTGRWGRGRECTGSCPPLSIGRLDLASARRHPLSSPRSAVTFWHPRPSTRSRTTAWNGRSL